MNYHLVILKRPYLQAILSGRKWIESRLQRIRPAYFSRVRPGDVLFLKQSSGPVCGLTTVAAVRYYQDLTPGRIDRIRQCYNHAICATEQYWRSRQNCRYGLLIWLKDPRAIEPIRIAKRDLRSWVVLGRQENFGLLSSGPDGAQRPCPEEISSRPQ